MGYTLLARCSGTVVASGDLPGTFTGTVDNGETPATFTGTVSLGLVNAYNATCIRTGFRLVLNGVEIPDADVVSCELKENVDAWITFLDFTLVGSDYAILANRETWTITPVEYYVINGPPGAEREELRFTGYVRTGSEQGAGAGSLRSGAGFGGASVKVSCYDELGRFAEFALCREIEPLSGYTRGAILRDFFSDAGFTAVDVPDGAVYTKGVIAKNAKLLAWAAPFVEPEGWKLRRRPRAFADGGGVLEAWTPVLKTAPLPPDDTWDLSRCQSIRIDPPRDVPSRWVVYGYGAVFVDELGQETKVQRTEVWDLYAPKVAIQEQNTSGVISSTGFSPESASLRMVQLIYDTTVSRGGKVITQQSEEWGWYNPRSAKQVTNTGTGGYSYRTCYIDEDGEFVAYAKERFTRIAWNRVTYSYDVDGSAIGATELVYRYFRETCGVKQVGDVGTSVVGAFVHGDDISYTNVSEQFGHAESHYTERTFDDTTGAETEVVVRSYGYVALKSLIGPGSHTDYYLLSNGLGQRTITADFQQFSEITKRNIISDGTLQGTIEIEKHLDTARVLKDFGTYQWGDYDSHEKQEKMMYAGYKRVQYNVLSGETYEKITREAGKTPVRETLTGKVPQPRYKASAWTYLAQQPIELIVDDPVVEELLGFRRELVGNDHIQSLAEAERVVRNRRARALAYRVTVSRNESHVRLGQTVFLKHPDHSLLHRGLLMEVSTRRSRPGASQNADYVFEVPL